MNKSWIVGLAFVMGMVLGVAIGEYLDRSAGPDDSGASSYATGKAFEAIEGAEEWAKDKAKEVRDWVSRRLPHDSGDDGEPKQSHPTFASQGE